MNKKLLLTSLFFVFFSTHKIYADFCERCCLDSVQTLYCPVIADKNAEKCSESCDCCDLTTHNITAVNETRQKCCLKDEKAYWDGDSAECCTGQTYKMTDTDYGCCPKGKELPTNCSVMGPDCKCTECDESQNYTLSDGKCCAEIDGCVTYGADCKCTKCDESGYFLNDYDECSLKTCDGVEVCDGQQDGTTCCTTDSSGSVVQGLCLGGECEYKQCTGDEKLYVYYPDYENIGGEITKGTAVLGCCANDPTKYYQEVAADGSDDLKMYQLCCSSSKPVPSESVMWYTTVVLEYGCFTQKTVLTYCASDDPKDTMETCEKYIWGERKYSVCENGIDTDKCIHKTEPPDDYFGADDTKYCFWSGCSVWECPCKE